jgi:xanthine dehydrogenase accessory factor
MVPASETPPTNRRNALTLSRLAMMTWLRRSSHLLANGCTVKSMPAIKEITARLAVQDAVLVTVHDTQGSVPREAGAWMLVFADLVHGTIGGGHLEFDAIAKRAAGCRGRAARRSAALCPRPEPGPVLRRRGAPALRALGAQDAPALQRRLQAELAPLALFGGGHVGKALVRVLAPLPFAVTWIDSRDEIFPDDVPDNVECEHSDPVQAAVTDLAPHSRVLIMSFSHAEDLDMVAACLKRLREKRRPALHRPDRQQDQVGHLPPSAGRARLSQAGTGAGHLPDRRARHHRQAARSDRRRRRGPAPASAASVTPQTCIHSRPQSQRRLPKESKRIGVRTQFFCATQLCSERPRW